MRVDKYAYLTEFCRKLGQSLQVDFVARIQSRKSLSLQVNNGQTEEAGTAFFDGIGIQVFDEQGYMGFAASDEISEEIVSELFRKAVFLADQSKKFNGEPSLEYQKLPVLQKRIEVNTPQPYGSLGLDEVTRKITVLNNELRALDKILSVRTSFRIIDEEWRIFRSDGTDTQFNIPRALIMHSITAKFDQEAATTHANISGVDFQILTESEYLTRLKHKAEKSARLALKLLKAGRLPAGNYKLVIDYALAKGLAHEAFGHAAETDGLESSILGENRRLKVGMPVANPRLSIIDGPLEGDHAYQPISAMGAERKTVTIVDHGILKAGLSDVFSAAIAGVTYTGAERVESCFNLPIARMSNIRIEFDNPIPLNQPFETVTPLDLYRVMQESKLIQPNEQVLYLSGFQGGQVNPAFGDFVFHCSGIYQLGSEPVLYKPAIFSGKILSVLQSVSNAIGPLQLDAIGTCGKMGQGVPSCGGSHYFLVIEANPEIMIGGE